MNVKDISIKDYTYTLPPEKIARYPLKKRDDCKLLLYRKGKIEETRFDHLVQFLPENAFLVFNNTKVIPARFHFRKETGARIEIFCLKPLFPSSYEEVFEKEGMCRWECVIGNNDRWKGGKLSLSTQTKEGKELAFTAERIGGENGHFEVEFSWNLPISFASMMDNLGEIPIPPYLERPSEISDKTDYQTIYSKIQGSVASPTAGLHFTEDTFKSLKENSIPWGELTLHVGAGTFLPVKSNTIGGHTMHFEMFSIEKFFIESLILHTGNIVAVGTTSVRTLESLYAIGCRLHQHPETPPQIFEVPQWVAYEPFVDTYKDYKKLSAEEALHTILQWMNRNHLEKLHGNTGIIIVPSYSFRVVNGMITNFHQPQSTLLLLIVAFVGENWGKIYDYALEHNFRFLSYGDASLLLP